MLVIGDEILTGKVEDSNSPWVARRCRSLGLQLCRIIVLPDDIEQVAAAVAEWSRRCDFVFTSGGVGPTHDDLTMEAVAKAFGRKLVLNEAMCDRIARHQQEPLNESQRKMAMLPEGAKAVDAGDLWFPIVIVENVHVFPGIPQLFEKKFEAIRDRFSGDPFHLRQVYVTRHESDIAQSLHDLLGDFPNVMLGSYPRLGETHYRVLLTLESRDLAYLERALASLLERIPDEAVHRVE